MSRESRREYGTGTVYQRSSDGRWIGAYPLPNGKLKHVSDMTEEGCIKKLKALRKNILAGNIHYGRDTVGAMIEQYLEDTVRPNRKHNTYLAYESVARNHIIPALGRARLAKLQPEQMQEFIADKQKELAPNSVRLLRTLLICSLEQAHLWHKVDWNVARLTTLTAKAQVKRHPLTLATLPAFLEAVRGHMFEVHYLLILGCGLRIGEALGMGRSFIDLPARILRVEQQLDREDGEWILPKTKRPASERDVPIPEFTAAALERHLAQPRSLPPGGAVPFKFADLIFLDPEWRPLWDGHVREHLYRLCRDKGLPRLQPHDLRRSYGNILNELKADPTTIQALMGHADVSTTLGYYTQSSLDSKRRAVDLLNSVV